MAITYNVQTLVETTKRVVVKLVGGGAADEAGNVVINTLALTGFKGLQGNIGLLGIKAIHYSVTTNAAVKLFWYGANSNSTIAILSGCGTFPEPGSDGFVMTPNANGSTGNIWVQTTGFNNAQAGYTIVLDIHKDPAYFDPGTANDPAAFNR